MEGRRLRRLLFWLGPVSGCVAYASVWMVAGPSRRQRLCFVSGGGLGLFFALVLLVAHRRGPRRLREHPQPIIFWRCVADAGTAVQFIAYAYARRRCDTPRGRVSSGLLEFSMIASEGWYFASVHDARASFRSPFTPKVALMRCYHRIVWVSALFMAVFVAEIPGVDGEYLIGEEMFGYCLFKSSKVWPPWVFLYAPILVLYAGALAMTLACLGSAYERSAKTRAFAEHLHAIAVTNANLVAACMYWGLFSIFYFGSSYMRIRGATYAAALLLPAKGAVDFMVWLLPLDPSDVGAALGLGNMVDEPRCSSVDDRDDLLASAQGREIFDYVRCGIAESRGRAVVMLARRRDEPALGFWAFARRALAPTVEARQVLRDLCTESHHPVCVVDASRVLFRSIARDSLRRLRATFGISETDYARSWRAVTKARYSDGASGAFFLFSADERFLAKTATATEIRALARRADALAAYCSPDTKLCRIVGAHTLEIYGQPFHLVVQENLFFGSDASLLRRYDIKGSSVNRRSGDKFEKSRALLLEQPLNYSRGGGGGGGCVGKDDDLQDDLHIDPRDAALLLAQLDRDSRFLASQNIMDYSLLIGVDDLPRPPLCCTDNNRNSTSSSSSSSFLVQAEACRYDATFGGPSAYTLAIIDLLQEWNWAKKLERAYKIIFRCRPPLGLSAIDPVRYQRRFMARVHDIIPIARDAEIVA
ncbi:hypothetical protein CTAYLR_003540 [Chrysophaeum taylorii]|uniref:PIPK domain-containing protein n=1 Tax=Chrysophaeum taylorii TaxID=2483200 RepID=A0AAD7XJY8_9STRA|nr:hypothetical protein CTAYLR_003540 [Chrysophaeum taylorii]